MGNALSAYERGVERFCEDLARVELGFWSGRAPRADAAAVYRRHSRLFGREPIEALRARAAEGGPEAARPRRLLEFALAESANARRLPHDGRVALAARTVPLRAGGRVVTLGSLAAALAAEPGAHRRRALEAERSRVLAGQVDGDLSAARDAALEAVGEAGHRTLGEAFEEGAGFSLGALAGTCRGLLDATAEEVGPCIEMLAERAGLDAGSGLGIADFPRLLAGGAGDANEAGRAAPTPGELLAGLCAGLGLPAPEASGIEIDAGSRPGKAVRGFCVAVRVPGEIRLAVDPAAAAGSETLLHEAGHALHRAHTDPGLDVGARRLGDNGVSESWAFLFEGLAGSVGGAGPATAEVRERARARRLLLVRRHCARLIYELELDREWGPPGGGVAQRRERRDRLAPRYAELLSEATGVEWSAGGWLFDLDPGFYSARYLRGWMLAAEWRRELTSRFGDGWPASAEAGEWLRDRWSVGQSLDAAELCRAALGRELEPGALEEELALSAPAAFRSRR